MLFMIELLQKCLKQPATDPDQCFFNEDVKQGLDLATDTAAANLPLFFMVHLSHFFGFRLMDNFSAERQVLDLREGQFVAAVPPHEFYLSSSQSTYIAQLLRALQVQDLEQISMNRQLRNELIDRCIDFYGLHIQPFGTMRSLPVIRTLLEG
jgi:DNA repair protein RecO (recombination protein O)